MRVKLQNGFWYGFTGTPIDRTLQNTHRDFGPLTDGVQERHLSYYGIRRSIQDGATLEVHYVRDTVPIDVDEQPLNIGVRADLRGVGTRGRRSQRLRSAPEITVEGIGTASRPCRYRAQQDARTLSGTS